MQNEYTGRAERLEKVVILAVTNQLKLLKNKFFHLPYIDVIQF